MSNLILPVPLKGGIAQTKDSFHQDGRSFLKRLQSVLGCAGKVRSVRAGPAVYGNVWLTTEPFGLNAKRLEVAFYTDQFADQPAQIKILYRELRQDDTGSLRPGANCWIALSEVEADPEAFLRLLRS